MESMGESWKNFVKTAKRKINSHSKTSNFWKRLDVVFRFFFIIISAVTTGGALTKETPKLALAALSATATIISSFAAFLKPGEKANKHEEAVRIYRSLMMRMIHCESMTEYHKIWEEFNKYLLEEPMALSCYATRLAEIKWKMTTPLFQEISRHDKSDTLLREISVTMEESSHRAFSAMPGLHDRKAADEEEESVEECKEDDDVEEGDHENSKRKRKKKNKKRKEHSGYNQLSIDEDMHE